LPAPAGIASEDDVTAAAALNQGIEQCIALCPEQYLWSYRRFRRRPSGGCKVYTGPLGDQAAIETARRLRHSG
jgi:KDO2-lipid IV(A) lauroyltransferase